MVLPPGHFASVQSASAPTNRRHQRNIAVALCVVLLACAAGVTVWSLSKTEPTTGHGCISFSFLTAFGGGASYNCGATARRLCASPVPTVVTNDSYYRDMHVACRKAGLKTSADPHSSGS